MEERRWRGLKYKGNKKQAGRLWSEIVGNGERLYWKSRNTANCRMMMMMMMISGSAVFLLPLLSRLVCNGSLRSHERIWGSGGITSSTGRFTLCENYPSTLRIGCQVNRRPSWRYGGTQTVFDPSRWFTISLPNWLSQRVIIRIPGHPLSCDGARPLLNIGSWCHKGVRQLHCLRVPGWSLAPH